MRESRISALNTAAVRPGRYFLYWMQASQRAVDNPTLDVAIERANDLSLPVLCGFGLSSSYPEVNLRHFNFMLEGLAETKVRCAEIGVQLVVLLAEPDEAALRCAADAALVVCDRGYLRLQRKWRARVAQASPCMVLQVEGDVVVPVAAVSTKRECSAATLRPKIHRLMDAFLSPPRSPRPRKGSLGIRIAGDVRSPPVSRDCRAHGGCRNGGSLFQRGHARDKAHRPDARAHAHVLGQENPGMEPFPAAAFRTALRLNNRWFLDGRDPNSYAGVAWCFGLHDRPWGERPIFGMVRYMNDTGLRRKFDMETCLRAFGA